MRENVANDRNFCKCPRRNGGIKLDAGDGGAIAHIIGERAGMKMEAATLRPGVGSRVSHGDHQNREQLGLGACSIAGISR